MTFPILYFITDATAPISVRDQCLAAIAGGAKWIQFRNKTASDADFLATAKGLLPLVRARGAKLIINDRVDIAIAAQADGLHIGQSDGNPDDIRARIGNAMILGLSTHTLAQAQAAPASVDYIGVGPIFPTTSKADAEPAIGLDTLQAIVSASTLPCYAIGGIKARDVAAIKHTGATGISVISAISRAENPQHAAKHLIQTWENA